MIKKVIRILFAPIGGALGYWLWRLVEMLLATLNLTLPDWLVLLLEIACVSALAVVGFFVGGPISTWCAETLAKITKKSKEMPAKDLFLAVFGLLIGFVGAFLICQIFNKISNEILVTSINAIVYICCGFLGMRIVLMRRDEISLPLKRKKGEDNDKGDFSGGTVLDSSVLIDGRVFDIYKTGFLKEPIYIPKFILDELSRLADSDDNRKRTRGRIGLDAVKNMRKENNVIISAKDYADKETVDDKIITFANEMGADIMTNDYSLNMVASLQGVRILNINELGNAIKPTVVAGDELNIEVSKIGKDPTQGVGYLDDGTMIVVENGSDYVGQFVEIVVTSMLQTNSGKIIFGKIKDKE